MYFRWCDQPTVDLLPPLGALTGVTEDDIGRSYNTTFIATVTTGKWKIFNISPINRGGKSGGT